MKPGQLITITTIIKKCILIVFALALFGCGERVHIAYKVVDDNGTPVEGAKVTASFETGGSWNGEVPSKIHSKSGLTDNMGIFIYKAHIKRSLIASATKDGYYKTTTADIRAFDFKHSTRNYVTDPIVITIKKKINPVKMYAKHVDTNFPISNGTVGYDLIRGSFVEPYGSGEVSDFIFHIDQNKIDVTFSNIDDGIQPFFVQNRHSPHSQLKSAQNAPSTGYFKSLSEADFGWKEKYKTMGDRTWIEEVNYYFRVRSNKGDGPLYGKIYGYFMPGNYDKPTGPHIEFTYYLNPDKTNNVEFAGSFFPSSPAVGFENPPGVP